MLEKAHRHLAVALAFGAAVLVGACAGGDNANEGDTAAVGTSTGTVDTAGGAGGTGTSGPMSDAQIVGFSNMVDQAEVEAGELARDKGQNAAVKEYARTMVTEHSNHMRQAGQLAQQGGTNPSEPTNDPLAQQHDQLMSSLRSASGAAFDSLYINGMVQEHQGALSRLNTAMNDTQNAQLREFLNTTRETVQRHLERAQQVQGQLSSWGGNR
jgi:putative membrane protein